MIKINANKLEKIEAKKSLSFYPFDKDSKKRIKDSFKHYPNETKSALLAAVEKHLFDVLLKEGVEVGGLIFQTDETAQANASGYLTAYNAGINIFPITWRLKNNTSTIIPDIDAFRVITISILNKVQTSYQKTWTTKDLIQGATTGKDLTDALDFLIND